MGPPALHNCGGQNTPLTSPPFLPIILARADNVWGLAFEHWSVASPNQTPSANSIIIMNLSYRALSPLGEQYNHH